MVRVLDRVIVRWGRGYYRACKMGDGIGVGSSRIDGVRVGSDWSNPESRFGNRSQEQGTESRLGSGSGDAQSGGGGGAGSLAQNRIGVGN